MTEIFSMLITLLILYCLMRIFIGFVFGKAAPFIPPEVRRIPRYGGRGIRYASGQAYYHGYKKQAERRGVIFGLWHAVTLILIVATLSYLFDYLDGKTFRFVIPLWPATIIVGIVIFWWQKQRSKRYQLPGRPRKRK